MRPSASCIHLVEGLCTKKVLCTNKYSAVTRIKLLQAFELIHDKACSQAAGKKVMVLQLKCKCFCQRQGSGLQMGKSLKLI